jgi:hypothetical protein
MTYRRASSGTAFSTIGTRGSRNSLNASLACVRSERRLQGRDSQDEMRIPMPFPSQYHPTTEWDGLDLGYVDCGDGPIASAAGESGHTGTGAEMYEACARFAWKRAICEAMNCSFISRRATM